MKNLLTIIILFTLLSCEKQPDPYEIEKPTYQICTIFIDSVSITTLNDSIYNNLYVIKYIEDLTDSDPFYLNGGNRIDFQIKAESITLKLYPFNCNDQITYVKVKVFIDRVFYTEVEGEGKYLRIL